MKLMKQELRMQSRYLASDDDWTVTFALEFYEDSTEKFHNLMDFQMSQYTQGRTKKLFESKKFKGLFENFLLAKVSEVFEEIKQTLMKHSD